MTTLIVCLLIAVILPYLAKIPVGYAMQKAGGYNNNYPREQQAKLEGFGARALAAHQNCFESLAVFSTAALTAIATNHVTSSIQLLAIVYIICRVIYNILYLMDLAALRSTVWFISLVSCISILWLCIP
ncbi:MAPEG family protein [Legionella bononiensis]|uniref:MAPEG family protein n=1 Tax=Legionella bononiensis TaxID=2793102 RepID=A0ABS1WAB6_9GAMM|nr:MAPEG family protein [Legionella bononiensis]MBL7480469.1 MAPEG family protein [Legionella bononiensis]MBL7526296.1 MAPEG family protein [Legionella bononiensis]MBL7563209.1 MAPEG family protein [Legionella bononiensis]